MNKVERNRWGCFFAKTLATQSSLFGRAFLIFAMFALQLLGSRVHAKAKMGTDSTTVKCRAGYQPSSHRVGGIVNIKCVPKTATKAKHKLPTKPRPAPKPTPKPAPQQPEQPVIIPLPIVKVEPATSHRNDMSRFRSSQHQRSLGNFDSLYFSVTLDYWKASLAASGSETKQAINPNGAVLSNSPGINSSPVSGYNEDQIQSNLLSSFIVGYGAYISDNIDMLIGAELELSVMGLAKLANGTIVFNQFEMPYDSMIAKLTPLLSGSLRLGYMINSAVMPYLKIGPSLSNLIYSLDQNRYDLAKTNTNESLLGIQGGGGLDLALTSNVHLRIEYVMHHYESYDRTLHSKIRIIDADNKSVTTEKDRNDTYSFMSHVFRVAVTFNF